MRSVAAWWFEVPTLDKVSVDLLVVLGTTVARLLYGIECSVTVAAPID